MLEAIAEVRRADAVARRKNVDTVQRRNVEHDAAGDDRRVRVGAGLAPSAAAEMLSVAEAVEDAAVVAEMIESIDVGAGVGVERDRVARVGNQIVGRGADVHHVIDLLT